MQFSWIRQLPHATAVVVMRRCRVILFEKPEVIDKTGWGAHRHTTSLDAGMIDTANVACTDEARLTYDMLAVPPLHSRQQVYDKLT